MWDIAVYFDSGPREGRVHILGAGPQPSHGQGVWQGCAKRRCLTAVHDMGWRPVLEWGRVGLLHINKLVA